MELARVAEHRRWRWPAHFWALVVLVPLSLLVGYKAWIEDAGPFFGRIHYHRVRMLDRDEIAARRPPTSHIHYSRPVGGYTDVYPNVWRDDGNLAYCQYDEPHLPFGKYGAGDPNPRPSSVARHEVYAIDRDIPLAVIGAAWVIWVWRVVRYRRQHSSRRAGFEVLPAVPQQD